MRVALSRNVLANVINALSGIGIALISTPIVIDQVGIAGYGVWTIALGFILYLAIAEAGFGPAAQRFIAVSRGRSDLDTAARIMWTTLALYVLAGVAVAAALFLLADPIIGLFDVPADLRTDADDLLRLVGIALAVALAATALSNVQAGLERFTAVAAATVTGSVVFLVMIIWLAASGAGLYELGYAVLVQQVVMLAIRLLTLRDVVRSGPPRFTRRAELRELAVFSAKLQISVLSVLINGQSDRVVVGLVAPASTLGQFGIGSQFAEAGRLVGAAALTPMISRLSVRKGEGDEETLAAEFGRLNRVWLMAVIGATGIAVASAYPLIAGWLGSGYREAIGFAVILVLGSGMSLLPGTRLAYLRATNNVGVEAWVGTVTTTMNVALTVPLAVLFGPTGVVLGTLGAYTAGAAYYFHRFREYAPRAPALPLAALARAAISAAVAGGCSLGWGILMIRLLPAGVALVPVVAGTVGAFALYLWLATGVRPSRAGVRAWLAPGSEAPAVGA